MTVSVDQISAVSSLKNGFNIETTADGTTYQGMYQNGKKHGPGIMIFKNGVTYHGIWEYG